LIVNNVIANVVFANDNVLLGLGLYSLAKRMDAIKGYYGASKRPDGNHGSIFWFAIPYRPDPVVAAFIHEMEEENMNATIERMNQKKKILPFGFVKEAAVTVTVPITSVVAIVPLPPRSKRRKILLVDDSPTIIRMMSMMLTRQGYEVIIAENGMIALQKVEQAASDLEEGEDGSKYDMILMDMQMPIMDGIEATKRIRIFERLSSQQQQQQQQQPRDEPHRLTAVIGMSANSDEETKEAALVAGVNEFVTKPISMEVCSRLIAKYSPSK